MAEILIAIRFQFRTVVVRQERNRWRMNKQKGGTPSGRGYRLSLRGVPEGGQLGSPVYSFSISIMDICSGVIPFLFP